MNMCNHYYEFNMQLSNIHIRLKAPSGEYGLIFVAF
jgi:hypothetical protein